VRAATGAVRVQLPVDLLNNGFRCTIEPWPVSSGTVTLEVTDRDVTGP
jgi:hypothetical protein